MRTLANASILVQLVLLMTVLLAASCTATAVEDIKQPVKEPVIPPEQFLSPCEESEERYEFDELGIDPVIIPQPCEKMIAFGG
jgi:diphthamide synthase subunit DPH2